ncbi:MAG: hypothetical protein IKH77_05325 [Clostridia bacterium]|nr:hypothetical protein [Clostridia bacterium]
MAGNGEDSYSYTYTPRDLFGTDLMDGDQIVYQARLTGVGMDKTTEPLSVTVENLAPANTKGIQTKNNPFLNLVTHDPFTATYEDEKEDLTLDLSGYFNEPDGEEITYTAKETGNAKLFGELTIDEDRHTLRAVTKDQTTDAKQESTIHITAKDPEGKEATLDIPASLTVQREVVKKNYTVKVSADTNQVKPNGNIKFTAKLYDQNDKEVTDSSKLAWVNMGTLSTTMNYEQENRQPETRELKWQLEGTAWTCEYGFPANSGTLTISGWKPVIQNIQIGTNDYPKTFSTDSSTPRLKEGAAVPAFTDIRLHDPITGETETDYETYTADWDTTVNLAELVEEPDGEALSFHLTEPASGKNEVVTAVVDQTTGKLTLSTRGVDKTGGTTVNVEARDPEKKSYIFSIPVEVTNVRDTMGGWHLSASLTEQNGKAHPDGTALNQGSIYNLVLTLQDSEDNEIRNYDKLTQLVNCLNDSGLTFQFKADNATQAEPVELTWNKENGKLTAEFTTGQNKGEYSLAGNATLQGGDIEFSLQAPFTCKLENLPPTLNTETFEEKGYGETAQLEIEPLLWRRKNDSVTEIDLKDLFTDGPKDPLQYYAVRLSDLLAAEKEKAAAGAQEGTTIPEPARPENAEEMGQRWGSLVGSKGTLPASAMMALVTGENDPADEPGHILKIDNTAEGSGDHAYVLVAEDRDGQKAYAIYDQHVISQKTEVLRLLMWIGLGILVLIILQQLFYWVFYRAAWKNSHGTVTTVVNGHSTNHTTNFRRSGKGEMRLSDLQVTVGCDQAMATALKKDIEGYKLRPGRNNNVIVRRTKAPGANFTVAVNGADMGRHKKMNWPAGGVLTIKGTAAQPGKSVDVRRVNMPQGAAPRPAAAPRANAPRV